ncbi:MAG: cation-translocating P-type ATPase [Burkholderiales bacterium]|nr:cation-translocating P-type ATPase [Anaerolineae bacterium]
MPDFYRLTVEQTLTELKSTPSLGLTDAEVAARQQQYGKNVLPTSSGSGIIKIIISQFADLMVLILIAAGVISFLVGDVKDVIVILAIVVLNAILGVYQEYQAEQALAALSAMQVPLVSVRRNHEVHQISAEELVPGDIILLEEGDSIPADGRLITSINLQVVEAALTGESLPVEKDTAPIAGKEDVPIGDRHNMVFMGTAINYGRGEMIVTTTGLQTQLGNIAAMLMRVEEGITPLQRRLNKLGQTLAIGAAGVVAIVFVAGLLRGIPLADMFLTSISLAVAAVPEGLPAIITISLSLGAARMVRRNALIRRLPAVETLGSVTIICSDKTGTLTKNEMTATRLAVPKFNNIEVTGIGYTPQGDFFLKGEPLDPRTNPQIGRFLMSMALSTNAHLERTNGSATSVVGDTTEGALLVAAQKVGWTREQLETDLPRINELPFSSERKAMTTIHKVATPQAIEMFEETPYISITKGAPDKLLDWAAYERMPEGSVPMTDERRKVWQEEIDSMAAQGLRVLGIAYRPLDTLPGKLTEDIERDLHMLGLVGIVDPARPEAKEAVRVAREAGIRSIMITGDHALTAEAIARDLGIQKEGEKVVTGTMLDKMSDDELSKALQITSTFARVSPEHKLRVVQVLQRQNEIVAMTGDGVNDAPALKQADIGVAMGITGTDVSKGAAEMVLTDDNFASIVAAVEEGRVVYDNIRKFVRYLLSSNVGEILVMFIALIIGFKIPLLAIQILWINLVTDGLPAIALGFEPGERDVMRRKPRPPQESIFAGGMGQHIIWVSILLTVITLGGYVYGYASHKMDPLSRTLGLEHLTYTELDELVGDEEVEIPANWDSLSLEEKEVLVLGGEPEDASYVEPTSEGILGHAERIPRTIAFTVLALGQIFHVMAIHGGDKTSFFKVWFSHNRWLFYAILSTFALQLAVIYVPFLRATFETVPLGLTELVISLGLASIILFAVELEKSLRRRRVEKLPEAAGGVF